MRSRPDVEISVPTFVHPGEPLVVALRVHSSSETPIDFIEIELKSLQYQRRERRSTFESSEVLAQSIKVAEHGTLAVGEHGYRATFRIPTNAYPTYLGQLFQYRHILKLHVSIPWWPDVVERRDVVVLLPPSKRGTAMPFAGSNVAGLAPFVEISLNDQHFAPGEVIEGGLAFGNLGGRKASQATLSLIGHERRKPSTVAEVHRFTAVKRLEGVEEGAEVPFQFAVPKTAIPSFDIAHGTSLSWTFQVQIQPRRGAPVTHSVPIHLARFDRPAEAETPRHRLGNARWRTVWGQVARSAGLTLDTTELELVGAFDGCSVTVKIDTDSNGKQRLAGELRWKPWGLGLSINNRGLLDLGIDLDNTDFSRRFRVRGRDEAQVKATLSPELLSAFAAFDEIDADDQRARIRSRTPGHDQPWIGQFVRQLQTLAEALGDASSLVPPPPSLADHLPEYRRFAEELGARIEVGSLSLHGARLDGARFELSTDFRGGVEPRGTLITLELDPPLPRPVDPANPEELAALPLPTRRLLDELGDQLRTLHWERGVSLDDDQIPKPQISERAITVGISAPLTDPARARAAMCTMIALGEALRSERRHGPYR